MNKVTVRRAIELGTAILLLSVIAFPAQMDPKFAQAQQQNAAALKQYTWKSRTEIRKDGETKNVQMAFMRYDNDGWLQKTPISSSPQQQLPTRGLRGLIAQKKKEDFVETVERLANLAKSYSELRPDQMQRFMATATVAPDMNQQQKLFRISGAGVLQPNDSMTIWVDAVSHKQRRVEIHTALDRKPVTIVSDFQDLPMGPTYMARSVVNDPGNSLTLITENFDYERVR